MSHPPTFPFPFFLVALILNSGYIHDTGKDIQTKHARSSDLTSCQTVMCRLLLSTYCFLACLGHAAAEWGPNGDFIIDKKGTKFLGQVTGRLPTGAGGQESI